MEAPQEAWRLNLVRTPREAYAELSHWHRSFGVVTWMVAPWQAPVDPVTELEVLQELYSVLTEMMELRASR
jgi:hypothetical protein